MKGVSRVLMKADWELQRGQLTEITSIRCDCMILEVSLEGYDKMDSFIQEMKTIINQKGDIKTTDILMYFIESGEPFNLKFEWNKRRTIFFNIKSYFVIRKVQRKIYKIRVV